MMKAIVLVLLACAAQAAVKLPALISDNMVLQQRMPVRIWGSATPGEEVTVTLGQTQVKAFALEDGRFDVFLPPLSAGGPYTMTIAGSNTITIQNVLVGEVWVASGQSNMVWLLRNSTNAEKEIAAANHPQIRFFQVKTTVSATPQTDVTDASWKVCTPENAPVFSGVAYFFARHLMETRGVPVGIVQSAVGGTPAQAWTRHEALFDDLNLHWYLDNWDKAAKQYPAQKKKYDQALAKWKKEAAAAKAAGKAVPRAPSQPQGAPGHPHSPSGLYNGMIAPLVDYGIRGAIWYQGEANAGPTDNELYRRLFGAMILDWRKQWGQGQFPFLWVQLASFNPPAGREWAVIRDSQTATLELANTGQALAIDVGEPNDIHPKDKLTVGTRLALTARAVAYGEKIEYSGPELRGVTRERNALRVWFHHVGSGLAAKDGQQLTGFRISNSDRRFFKAEAVLEGNTVVVSSPLVKEPVYVRYAWENDPVANLINKEGLPAVPFRTDGK